ncbi:AMP-binding protein [Ornithinimicrobium sp. Arc0846-15]|nr:AMP-binding protein [Ornithinimicrobium laminariae]
MKLVVDTLPPEQAWDVVASALSGADPVLIAPGGSGVSAPDSSSSDAGLLNGAAIAMATSGSTGLPKWVVLEGDALRASAEATLEHLGGPGQWLQPLRLAHIAGWQVWTRSVLAGIPPVLLPAGSGHFSIAAFAEASTQMNLAQRRYTALVPTQVHRLLSDPVGIAALQSFHTVLIGGAALPPAMKAQLDAHGISTITTYGMTETGGGCLYNGTPLPGYAVRTTDDGRLQLSGPSLARGYLGDDELTTASFSQDQGRRWFTTGDLGQQRDGVWQVLGRADDVINTGAKKVLPARVEASLQQVSHIEQACALGIADPEWGQRLVAAVVLDDPAAAPANATDWIRGVLRDSLDAHEIPRDILVLDQLPLLPGGKVDKATLRRLLTDSSGTI